MPALTQNYSLTKLLPGDSPSANGYAFFDSNIDRIDALLALGRDHEHTGASGSLTDPDTAPVLTLNAGSGAIPAGTTVRYRYTYVDQFGNETAGSPEATVTTPNPIVAPGAPALSFTDTGGTLTGGLYYYGLTAYTNTDIEETRMGLPRTISIAFTTSTNEITLTLPSLPAGADGFNVYRRSPNQNSYNYLASIDMTVATPPTTYVDDGVTAPNCDRHPPSANQTNSQSNIDISLPGATPTIPAGATWKIYRTYTVGQWVSSDLYHVITAATSYNDVGLATGSQSIPETSLIAAQPGKIGLTDIEEVEGYLPVGRNIIPYEITFTYGGPLAVVTGTNVWRNPFDNIQIIEVCATLGIGFSPASSDVIVDVNWWDASSPTPAFATIYSTQANRPKVTVGNQVGTATVPDVIDFAKGDMLSIDIDQIGGGATPTDEDLTVTVYMLVKSEDEDTTVVIP